MQPIMMADVSAFTTQEKSGDRSALEMVTQSSYNPFAVGVGSEGFHTLMPAAPFRLSRAELVASYVDLGGLGLPSLLYRC